MSSWMPSAFTTVPVCVNIPRRLKPEPPNGSQPLNLERRSMQTLLWASGALMRNRVLIETAPTMQSASSAPKVQSYNTLIPSSKVPLNIKAKPHSNSLFQQITVQTFRESGVHGQTGVHVLPSVVRWGSNCAPETASHTPQLALGLNWREKNAMGQNAPNQVS